MIVKGESGNECNTTTAGNVRSDSGSDNDGDGNDDSDSNISNIINDDQGNNNCRLLMVLLLLIIARCITFSGSFV